MTLPEVWSPRTTPRFSIWTTRENTSDADADRPSTSTASFSRESIVPRLDHDRLGFFPSDSIADFDLILKHAAYKVLQRLNTPSWIFTQIQNQSFVFAALCLPINVSTSDSEKANSGNFKIINSSPCSM